MQKAGLADSTSDEPVLTAVLPNEETGPEAPAVVSQSVRLVADEPPVSLVPEPTSLNSCASFSDPEELAEQLLQGKLIGPHSVLSLWELLPHEAPHKATSGSSFFTGLYRRGGVLGLRANVSRFPKVAQVLCAFVRQRRPSAVFTSLAIFCDIPTEPHRDSHNGPSPNLVFKLSDFSGGGVWCEGPGQDVRPVQGSPVQGRVLDFDNGCLELPAKDHWHMTEPWQGRRVVLVAYALPHMPSVKLEVPQALLELGFPLPPDFLPALSDVPPLSNPGGVDRVHRRGTCLSAGMCSLAQVLRAGLRAHDAHVMCSLKPFAICFVLLLVCNFREAVQCCKWLAFSRVPPGPPSRHAGGRVAFARALMCGLRVWHKCMPCVCRIQHMLCCALTLGIPIREEKCSCVAVYFMFLQ